MLPAAETSAATPAAPLTRASSRAVAGVLLGTVLQAIDGSIVNVAVPQIQGSFAAPLTELGWTITGYVLASLVSMPLAASLARRYGTRAYLLVSVGLFTATSVACGLAPSLGWLILFRVLQGFGAGGLLPIAQGYLMAVYTGPQRGRAIAILGVATVLGPLLGPPVGGLLTDAFGWRSIFFINAPLGILCLYLLRAVPDDRTSGADEPLDLQGALFLALSVSALQISCVGHLWLLVPGAAALYALVRSERRTPSPALDFGVLRHRELGGTLVAAALYGIGLYGSVFAVPLLMEHRLGMGAGAAGLVVAIGGLTSGAVILSSRRLLARFSARGLCAVGALLFALAMLWMAEVSWRGEGEVMFAQALRGAGTGLLYVGMNGFGFESIPGEELAMSASFFYLFRQLGGSIGVALCALAMAGASPAGGAVAFGMLAATAPLSLIPLALAAREPVDPALAAVEAPVA